MSNSYRVVVTGQQLNDDVAAIQAKLSETFDLPEKQLAALVCGKALIIKKNIDAPTAMKYKKAITACGLEVLVEAMNEESIVDADDLASHAQKLPSSKEAQSSLSTNTQDSSSKDSQDSSSKDSQNSSSKNSPNEDSSNKDSSNKGSQDSTVADSNIKMAPAGSRIGPRPSIARHDLPSTDHLTADFSERLAPESETGPAPPSVDHIGLGDVGETLVESKEVQPLEFDLDHIDVAPVGETLVEAAEVEAFDVNAVDFDLAAPGESLVEPKEDESLEIDLSHISLDESSAEKAK